MILPPPVRVINDTDVDKSAQPTSVLPAGRHNSNSSCQVLICWNYQGKMPYTLKQNNTTESWITEELYTTNSTVSIFNYTQIYNDWRCLHYIPMKHTFSNQNPVFQVDKQQWSFSEVQFCRTTLSAQGKHFTTSNVQALLRINAIMNATQCYQGTIEPYRLTGSSSLLSGF